MLVTVDVHANKTGVALTRQCGHDGSGADGGAYMPLGLAGLDLTHSTACNRRPSPSTSKRRTTGL